MILLDTVSEGDGSLLVDEEDTTEEATIGGILTLTSSLGTWFCELSSDAEIKPLATKVLKRLDTLFDAVLPTLELTVDDIGLLPNMLLTAANKLLELVGWASEELVVETGSDTGSG